MNNIIRLSKAILIMMLLSAQYSYATELHFPTLEETFRQNEQRIYENYQQEQEKRRAISQHATHTGDISLPHQYVNNEPIGFVKELTYTPVSTGNAVSLFRANEEHLWMQEIHLDR